MRHFGMTGGVIRQHSFMTPRALRQAGSWPLLFRRIAAQHAPVFFAMAVPGAPLLLLPEPASLAHAACRFGETLRVLACVHVQDILAVLQAQGCLINHACQARIKARTECVQSQNLPLQDRHNFGCLALAALRVVLCIVLRVVLRVVLCIAYSCLPVISFADIRN